MLRSGDKEFNEAVKKTMTTIGDRHAEIIEPVFLTQSKQLAFYWAEQTVKNRSARFADEGRAVVFAVTLPKQLNAQVKPDVGAASILLTKEGENYMAYLGGIFEANDLGFPEIDLMNANRMEYLNTLGMAYINKDIDASCLDKVAD